MPDLEFTEQLTPEETAAMDADRQAEFTPEPEPVAEPEPTPEATPEAEDKPPTQVPYGVLREERDRRQALEGEVAASRENVRRLEQMFTQLTEKMGQTPEPQTPAPDWDEDPDGYTRHMLDKLEQRLGSMEQGQQQTAQERQAQTQEQQFLAAYQNSVQQFQKPDFKDAYDHVTSTLDQELQHRGFHDPVQRAEILRAEERAIVERAFAAGKNPAEVIYNYAGFRGYKAPIGEDKLATIEQGQRAAASLPPGAADSAPNVNMERLLEAEGEEFDKLFNEAQRKGMLG